MCLVWPNTERSSTEQHVQALVLLYVASSVLCVPVGGWLWWNLTENSRERGWLAEWACVSLQATPTQAARRGESRLLRRKHNPLFQCLLPLGRREGLQLKAGLVDKYYRQIEVRIPHLQMTVKKNKHLLHVKFSIIQAKQTNKNKIHCWFWWILLIHIHSVLNDWYFS